MLAEILVIAGLECLAVCCFIAGFLVGKERTIKPCKPFRIQELPDGYLDPVSPEDQRLDRKLEEGAIKHGFTEEEDD